jgi:hypothetical protein
MTPPKFLPGQIVAFEWGDAYILTTVQRCVWLRSGRWEYAMDHETDLWPESWLTPYSELKFEEENK